VSKCFLLLPLITKCLNKIICVAVDVLICESIGGEFQVVKNLSASTLTSLVTYRAQEVSKVSIIFIIS